MLPAVIELIEVGVPAENGGWLLHRICARLEPRQLAVVVSSSPYERGAMLDAVTGRRIADEGRVWVSLRPVTRDTREDVRSRVIEANLSSPAAGHRSLMWNTLAADRLGLVTALFRVPRERRWREAIEALDRVGLAPRARDAAAALGPEERARLALARALSRHPD